MNDLPIKCDCGCQETKKVNVRKEDMDGYGTLIPVEWSLYCKGCGRYLGHFAYGHWEY